MIAFDKTGYIADRPVKPDQWPAVCPNLPDGAIITADGSVRGGLPPGILIMQNFVDDATCAAIVQECEALQGAEHTISAVDAKTLTSIESAARKSDFIDVRMLQTDITAIVRRAYTELVAPRFQTVIDWFELPEILRYKPGGEYKPHADSDNWLVTEQKWKRVIDRDLSILIYLNDEFDGGEIVFPNFGVKLKPSRGLLIAFPADCRYLHTARPVTAGVRYALVSWAAAKGGERVNDAPRPHAIRV